MIKQLSKIWKYHLTPYDLYIVSFRSATSEYHIIDLKTTELMIKQFSKIWKYHLTPYDLYIVSYTSATSEYHIIDLKTTKLMIEQLSDNSNIYYCK